MVREVLDALAPKPGGKFIDATLGDGGHAEAVLRATAPDGRLLGIERDPEMLKRAKRRLAPFKTRATFVHGTYANLRRIVEDRDFSESDGILFDLGVAALHVEGRGRGFSFSDDAPLDMRFDPMEPGRTAADIVNRESAETLRNIFREFGEERFAGKIANAIVADRPISSSRMLADLIRKTVPRRGRTHPATRVFQALRIAVNRELDVLETALPQAIGSLRTGGVCVVIAYHSLEDRIAKRFFLAEARRGRIAILTKKPQAPSLGERRENPRSRSAKLRAFQRLTDPLTPHP